MLLIVHSFSSMIFKTDMCPCNIWFDIVCIWCVCVLGVDSEAVSVYADADRLRCAGGGHRHCVVA